MCVTLPAKNLRLRLWRRVPQHASQSQDRSHCGGQCHTPDRARLKETLTDNRFCCLSPPVHIGLQAKTNLLSMNVAKQLMSVCKYVCRYVCYNVFRLCTYVCYNSCSANCGSELRRPSATRQMTEPGSQRASVTLTDNRF